MALHRLDATPATVSWGRFWSGLDPVLEVDPGDTVEIECFSGNRAAWPPEGSGMTVAPALRAICDADVKGHFGHLLTGPVAIRGAMPGDVLEVAIDSIELGSDWGYNLVRPLSGTLPGEFPVSLPALTHIPVDRAARTARLPWGAELALDPFFGVMGIAPPPEYGEVTSREPRVFGGNMDCKLLTRGATLFLPVQAEGALFSCGDGHGCQGDGEVCLTALEMALTGTFTFRLHKAGTLDIRYPRAETDTLLISFGFHADLDDAMRIALREMIAILTERTGITPTEAYQFCSLAVDFAVTQTVNGEKGVHGVLRKAALARG